MDAPGNILTAFESFFRVIAFGVLPPGVKPEIEPMVLLDDNSKGPYPIYRPFTCEYRQVGGGGQFTEIVIVNLDDATTHSVVVIDWLLVAVTVAGTDVLFAVRPVLPTLQGITPTLLLTNGGVAFDQGAERDRAPSDGIHIPNVGIYAYVLAAQQLASGIGGGANATLLPGYGDVLPHGVDGPWMLGPGSMLQLMPAAVNVGLTVYARGRYYPGG